jgi:hypothetical protein
VTLTAAQLASLKAGNAVSVSTSITGDDNLAHCHAISERCA